MDEEQLKLKNKIQKATLKFVASHSDLAWEKDILLTIPLKYRKSEVDLYTTKFWPYRLLHPGTATQIFFHDYLIKCLDRASEIYGGNKLREDHIAVRPSNKGMYWLGESPNKAIDIWRARQKADENGIPYWFFISRAMKLLSQRQISGPTWEAQFCGSHILPDVIKDWSERKRRGVILPNVRHFELSSIPVIWRCQREWENWISNRIQNSKLDNMTKTSMLSMYERFITQERYEDIVTSLEKSV